MKNAKGLLGFLFGIILMITVFFSFRSCFDFKINEKTESTDYYILTNQISKLNKMVVLEQDLSAMQKTKIAYKVFGSEVSSTNIITFTKTNAQVSYDLNKMKIDVDTINKKLIIRELPNPVIKVTPSVEIQAMDDSFINRISEKDIKNATQRAKNAGIKSVNQDKLKTEGKQQLMTNLNSIFVLAKALKYEIVDNTGTLGILKL
ncbi:hypothetical protein ASG01_01850 [Chryseobacterium sp. Leaf180]|uniref:DUF4230 domain-containing protein n=1 Tax=Chryseobacterium sp. Leaf180 TaxID=1736289 RepID=UPI000700DA6E|nr:DUF4230 domain-containing protein [Chryseobacterium sp. Leaf180]KQR94646.1 hypothetical protein ASG01_01850 [Chryseobacterium sp. Leaf180]